MILTSSSVFSQNGSGVKRILDELGINAHSYLLSATRPAYNVSASTLGKKTANIEINVVYSEGEVFELPMSFSYGVTDKVDIFTDISPFTQTYKFNGDKINGFGDIIAGIRYQFHQSKYFSHAVQTAVKIPTASKNKQLGTGRIDFHLGLAEEFIYKKFNYEISTEINFLRRRDLPGQIINLPVEIQHIIDSLKTVYDYKYETELVISGGPGVDITKWLLAYAGMSFSRNFKLDFNTLQAYSGLGFFVSDKTSLGIGGSFGLKNSSEWGVVSGLSLLF